MAMPPTLKSQHKEHIAIAYLDEDEDTTLCVGWNDCEQKRLSFKSYSEVMIYMDEDYIIPALPSKRFKCGYGNVYGFWGLLGMPYEDYTDRIECKSSYAEVESLQIFQRLVLSIPSLGTTLFTAGSLHYKEINFNAFHDKLKREGLYATRDYLKHNKFRDGRYFLAVIDTKNPEDSLERIKKKMSSDSYTGMILYDNDLEMIMGYLSFDYDRDDLPEGATKRNIDEMLVRFIEPDTKAYLNDEYLRRIPPEIRTPLVPKREELVKSEYESDLQFKRRVKDYAEYYNDRVKRLERKYLAKVQRRNEIVEALNNEYLKNSDNDIKSRTQHAEFFNKYASELGSIVYAQIFNTYFFGNLKYDANNRRLHGELFNKFGRTFSNAYIDVDPKTAKDIKYDAKQHEHQSPYGKTHKDPISAYATVTDDKVLLKHLTHHHGKSAHAIVMTQQSFVPTITKVYVAENVGIQEAQQSQPQAKTNHIQKPAKLMPNQTWYVDVSDYQAANAPDWFKIPAQGHYLGTAKKLDDAIANALGQMLLSQGGDYTIKQEEKNKVYGDHYLNSTTSRTSSVNAKGQLDKNAYRVIKQEYAEGMWYVDILKND